MKTWSPAARRVYGQAIALAVLGSLVACGSDVPAVQTDAGGVAIADGSAPVTDVIESAVDSTETTSGGATESTSSESSSTAAGGPEQETTTSTSGTGGPPARTTTTGPTTTGEPTTTAPVADPVTAFLTATSIFHKQCGDPPAGMRLWGELENGPTHVDRIFCLDRTGFESVRLTVITDGEVVLDLMPEQDQVGWYPGPHPGEYIVRLTGVPSPDAGGATDLVPATDLPSLDPGFDQAAPGRDPFDRAVIGPVAADVLC